MKAGDIVAVKILHLHSNGRDAWITSEGGDNIACVPLAALRPLPAMAKEDEAVLILASQVVWMGRNPDDWRPEIWHELAAAVEVRARATSKEPVVGISLRPVSKCSLNNVQCQFPDCIGKSCVEDRPAFLKYSPLAAHGNYVAGDPVSREALDAIMPGLNHDARYTVASTTVREGSVEVVPQEIPGPEPDEADEKERLLVAALGRLVVAVKAWRIDVKRTGGNTEHHIALINAVDAYNAALVQPDPEQELLEAVQETLDQLSGDPILQHDAETALRRMRAALAAMKERAS